MQKYFAIIVILLLASCRPSAPYEIKSPCVSNEVVDKYGTNPCIRRPVNLDHAIS